MNIELFISIGAAMDRFFTTRAEAQVITPEQLERMVAAHKRQASRKALQVRSNAAEKALVLAPRATTVRAPAVFTLQ